MNFDTYVLGRDTIFESMTDWLISTVKFINQINSKVKLVVRAHPGELSFVTPTRDFVRDSIVSVMHDKVVFVDADSSINSYDILDGASSVLVYSSTIGVEAILDGKTTVCAGSTFYDDFVLKPESKEKYFEVVEALTNHSLRLEINIIDLRKYLYYLYFERILALEGIGIHRSTGEDFIDTSYSAESLINMNRSVLERFYNEVSDEVAL
jgi:capsule polysaccharide export protein KpsC/LpsZ